MNYDELMTWVEQKVGRLRVRGSRWFSPEKIKRQAPSMAEGTVPNFNEVQRDLIALNKWPDRRITPDLKPGAAPTPWTLTSMSRTLSRCTAAWN